MRGGDFLVGVFILEVFHKKLIRSTSSKGLMLASHRRKPPVALDLKQLRCLLSEALFSAYPRRGLRFCSTRERYFSLYLAVSLLAYRSLPIASKELFPGSLRSQWLIGKNK